MGLAAVHPTGPGPDPAHRRGPAGVDAPRQFLGNRLVYLAVSPRARGLAVGLNLNPDRRCNFDCVYCHIDRTAALKAPEIDVELLAMELAQMLERVHRGQLRDLDGFRNLPAELLQLRHVAISGDGEPTLCPVFDDALRAVVHVRARGQFPFFRIVLLTNASALDQPAVQNGLRLLVPQDEVWAKLDAGTPEYFRRVNRTQVSLEHVLGNILLLGRQRPLVIQSLFPLLEGEEPPETEIDAYAGRLCELKAGGAHIHLVQIYSATCRTAKSDCGHLPLRTLSRIAHKIRTVTGLPVEVY